MKENYLMLNGQQIPFTDEQLEKIKDLLTNEKKRLSDVDVGGTFKIGKHEFFVLEHSGAGTAVLYKKKKKKSVKFGENNNNFTDHGCTIAKHLAAFADEIKTVIGEENLHIHEVDLTADDGLDDYGKTKSRMSLLTATQYRKYVRIIDKHKIDKWWWLVTPYSTPTHDDSAWVKCVSPSGRVNDFYRSSDCRGVRPFCILNPNIFVSI